VSFRISRTQSLLLKQTPRSASLARVVSPVGKVSVCSENSVSDHTLRYQLKQQSIHLSWESIRNIMSTQQRLTITLPTDNNNTIHLRTTTQAEARQKQLYAALSIKPDPTR